MAIFSTRTGTLRAICLSLLLSAGVHAQTISPSNDTSSLQGDVGFLMSTTLNNMAATIKIVPLTNDAGLAGSTNQLQAINPIGPLFLANPTTVNQLAPGDIAYISCEPSDYTGNIDASRCINFAVNNKPVAIVLFSEFSARCSFNPSNQFQYSSLYTMEDANSSSAVLKGLTTASPPQPNTSIHVDASTINGTNNNSENSVLGRSPTTAVAMIILYSITGIITALFLIIIIVGAIRAHRHPERYGPRRIVGRPRQSRAKGIARAMLETLPIVKFGELEEENKPANQPADIEMGVTNPKHEENVAAAKAVPEDSAEGSHTETREGTDVVHSEAATDIIAAQEEPTPKPENTVETGTAAVDNGLACSVCVEDFEKGQDVRVLPCKHRFHPVCIDPWLLNVSGTCPLCRTDLRPTASHSDGNGNGEEETTIAAPDTTSSEDATTAAAFNESTRRNRRSRILSTLNIGRMRNATPEERLAALRMLRNERMTGASTTSGDSTPRTRNRFSQRLSRTFGSSRPQSGQGTPRRNSSILASGGTSTPAEAHPPSMREMESTAEEPTNDDAGTSGLSPTEEVSPIREVPPGHDHSLDAQGAGSAQAADIPQLSTEPTSTHEQQQQRSSTADAAGGSEESNTKKAPPTEDERPNTTTSTTQEPQTDQATTTTAPDPSQPAAPAPTPAPPASTSSRPSSRPRGSPDSSPSSPEPNIAPFYSYR